MIDCSTSRKRCLLQTRTGVAMIHRALAMIHVSLMVFALCWFSFQMLKLIWQDMDTLHALEVSVDEVHAAMQELPQVQVPSESITAASQECHKYCM